MLTKIREGRPKLKLPKYHTAVSLQHRVAQRPAVLGAITDITDRISKSNSSLDEPPHPKDEAQDSVKKNQACKIATQLHCRICACNCA